MEEQKPKRKGRRSLYTPETVKVIIEVLESTGTDQAAYRAAGVSHGSFYTWIKDYPEFAAAVEEARAKFYSKKGEPTLEMIAKAREYILKVLDGLEFEEEIEPEVIEKIKTDTGWIMTKTGGRKKKVQPSTWMLERILGRAESETMERNSLDVTVRIEDFSGDDEEE